MQKVQHERGVFLLAISRPEFVTTKLGLKKTPNVPFCYLLEKVIAQNLRTVVPRAIVLPSIVLQAVALHSNTLE
jgi:hypothetical protein